MSIWFSILAFFHKQNIWLISKWPENIRIWRIFLTNYFLEESHTHQHLQLSHIFLPYFSFLHKISLRMFYWEYNIFRSFDFNKNPDCWEQIFLTKNACPNKMAEKLRMGISDKYKQQFLCNIGWKNTGKNYLIKVETKHLQFGLKFVTGENNLSIVDLINFDYRYDNFDFNKGFIQALLSTITNVNTLLYWGDSWIESFVQE